MLNPDINVRVKRKFTGIGMSLSIGEVSVRTGVSVRAIRHYDKKGLVTSVRGDNGYRYFSEQSVAQICQIRRLILAGFTLAEIETFPACMRREENREFCPETHDVLRKHLDEVDKHLCSLETQRERLLKALTGRKAN